MPTCPHCKDEIDYLSHFESRRVGSSFRINDNGKATYYEWEEDIGIDDPDAYYGCPSCGEIIASFEEDAIKFLKGEPI